VFKLILLISEQQHIYKIHEFYDLKKGSNTRVVEIKTEIFK